jgi:hypothetical protein
MPDLNELILDALKQSGPPQQKFGNFEAAKKDLNLNPEEQAFYQRHLNNLYGTGGVDNDDGTRSSLKQMTVEHNGRTYNIPSIVNGKALSEDDAWNNAVKEGLGKFPSYDSEDEAQSRYDKMHEYMDKDTKAFQSMPQGQNTMPQNSLTPVIGALFGQ